MTITPATINLYIIVATIIFTGFAFIWKRNNMVNLGIKMLMVIMALFGYILIFKS